ncbi:MAG: GtrA family protein [Candidatus Azobacteroides sp.]|nr:GtrA family protein [Candidatus Azobacteroides sp.]
MKKTFWLQAIKYGIVGVINTLLTIVIIWIMMYPVFQAGKQETVSPTIITVSNITGYTIGLINSFLWNRKWTFQSKNHWGKEFIKFTAAFLICYIPQLFLVNILNKYTAGPDLRFTIGNHPLEISYAYICQLIGMVFYTTLNFLLNKFYTFK